MEIKSRAALHLNFLRGGLALAGAVDAYARVARAHTGYIDLKQERALEVVIVPATEKQPAFGSFGFNKQDVEFRENVDEVLRTYLGSNEHRAMMHPFGFTDAEIDLVLGA